MKVLVTGGSGLCGSAIREESASSTHEFVFATREDADLTSPCEVESLFGDKRPDYVIHTAARVGGIGGNQAMHEQFLYDNLLINVNVIRNCCRFGVKKLLAFSSVCVFPDDLAILEEERIHDGPVFESNFAYGYAKRIVDVHIRAAEKQYGVRNWCSVIPGNIFGKHDMYSIEHGHIIPALMHKLHIAKKTGEDFVVWGDGKSLREFIYVNDLAKMLVYLLDEEEYPNKLIISGRREHSIREIVDILTQCASYEGKIVWDTSKPNGQRSRPSSKKRVDAIFPGFSYTPIEEALQISWDWFKQNYPSVRKEYK